MISINTDLGQMLIYVCSNREYADPTIGLPDEEKTLSLLKPKHKLRKYAGLQLSNHFLLFR